MAYEFGADERLHVAIVRCAREQLDRATVELTEGITRDPVRALHDARKAIKKERSLLRLARATMPAQERREANRTLRHAARGLSGARDAEVLLATLDGLAKHFAGQLPAATFDVIRDQLKSRHRSANGAGDRSGAERGAVEKLAAVRQRIDGWELAADDWPAIEAGLLRSYKRGRKALARARGSESPENLHDLRKRVKDLWYHARLIVPACGPTVRGQAKDAHRLADLLGDGHDLDLLHEELIREPLPVAVDVDSVIRLLELRRRELRAEALRLGARVYAEAPKAFRRRVGGTWRAGRKLALAPREQRPKEVAAATRER